MFLTSWFTNIKRIPNENERFVLDNLLKDIFPPQMMEAIDEYYPDFPERSKYVYEIVQVALLKSLIRIALIDDPNSRESRIHL